MAALTTLFCAGGRDQQAEFSVPFFHAFVTCFHIGYHRMVRCDKHVKPMSVSWSSQVSVALRFQKANLPNLHMRVLQGRQPETLEHLELDSIM